MSIPRNGVGPSPAGDGALLFYDLYLYVGLFVQPNVRWWPTVESYTPYYGRGVHSNV